VIAISDTGLTPPVIGCSNVPPFRAFWLQTLLSMVGAPDGAVVNEG